MPSPIVRTPRAEKKTALRSTGPPALKSRVWVVLVRLHLLSLLFLLLHLHLHLYRHLHPAPAPAPFVPHVLCSPAQPSHRYLPSTILPSHTRSSSHILILSSSHPASIRHQFPCSSARRLDEVSSSPDLSTSAHLLSITALTSSSGGPILENKDNLPRDRFLDRTGTGRKAATLTSSHLRFSSRAHRINPHLYPPTCSNLALSSRVVVCPTRSSTETS